MQYYWINLTAEEFLEKYQREAIIFQNQFKNQDTDWTVKSGTWRGDFNVLNFWIWKETGVRKPKLTRSYCNENAIFPKRKK